MTTKVERNPRLVYSEQELRDQLVKKYAPEPVAQLLEKITDTKSQIRSWQYDLRNQLVALQELIDYGNAQTITKGMNKYD